MASLIKRLQHIRFIKDKPRLFLRIADNIIRVKIFGQNRLRNTQIALTYGCNFRCEFCSATTLHDKKKELTTEQVKHVWDEIKKLGVIHVDLTGGEPTLRKDLTEIIKYISKNNDVIVSIATNGYLLREEKIREWKKAGLNSIFLSLHSMNPTVQDAITKVKGSYKRVIESAKIAKSLGLNVCINTVLTSENFDDVKRISEYARKNDLLLLLEPIATIGRSKNDSTSKKITNFYKEYKKLLGSGQHVRADTTTNFRNLGNDEMCPGGIEKWYITAYGEVIQCSFVQISYGNILEEGAKTIYKRMVSFPILSKKSDRCKHVFDKEFINKWFNPTRKFKQLPIKVYDHPYVKKNPKLREKLK